MSRRATRWDAPPPALHPDALVLGVDGSWECIGWSLATHRGPLVSGHVRPPDDPPEQVKRSGQRVRAVRALLEQLDHVVADHRLERAGRGAPPPRLVVEIAPAVYAGRGNQAVIGLQLGRLLGMLELWGCRPDWSPPWLVPTADELATRGKRKGDVLRHGWRPWWGYSHGASRQRLKAHAITLVRGLGWEAHLQGLDTTDVEGPAGDVAEAVLIAVGAARHPHHGPRPDLHP